MCGVERLSQLCAIELTKAALERAMRDTEGDLFQQRERMSCRNHGRFRMGNKISNGWWRVQDARASVGTKGLKAFQTSFDRNAEWRSGGVQVGAIADLSWGMGPRRRRSERPGAPASRLPCHCLSVPGRTAPGLELPPLEWWGALNCPRTHWQSGTRGDWLGGGGSSLPLPWSGTRRCTVRRVDWPLPTLDGNPASTFYFSQPEEKRDRSSPA